MEPCQICFQNHGMSKIWHTRPLHGNEADAKYQFFWPFGTTMPSVLLFLIQQQINQCLWVLNYSGPQLSHQKQIAHIKNKLLRSNSNCSHQNQIPHIKIKLLTSNSNGTLNSTTDRSAVEHAWLCVQVQFNMAVNESEQELYASGLFIPVEFVKKLLLDYN